MILVGLTPSELRNLICFADLAADPNQYGSTPAHWQINPLTLLYLKGIDEAMMIHYYSSKTHQWGI